MFKFLLFFFGFIAVFALLTKKYVNPYKLIMIFGKKGAGKSTLLTKFAFKHMKKGWTVYSTEYIPGTYHVEPEYIGFVELVDFNYKPFNADDYKGLTKAFKVFRNWVNPYRPKILLLIDEVGMIWDNRNFKNFKPEVRDFFKLQRHRCVKCILFSQTFDIDKKLRDLTDQMFLVCNLFRVFSYGKKIKKFITIKESQTDDSSNLAEGLKFEPFIFFLFGSRTLTFIPRWARYFDSYKVDKLQPLNFKKTSFSSSMKLTRKDMELCNFIDDSDEEDLDPEDSV